MDTPALAGVIVACVVGMGVLCWLSMLCRMYFFYDMAEGTGPQQVFAASDSDCCTLACIDCNEGILKQCCPHLHYERLLFNKNVVDASLGNNNNNSMGGGGSFALGAMGGLLAANMA